MSIKNAIKSIRSKKEIPIPSTERVRKVLFTSSSSKLGGLLKNLLLLFSNHFRLLIAIFLKRQSYDSVSLWEIYKFAFKIIIFRHVCRLENTSEAFYYVTFSLLWVMTRTNFLLLIFSFVNKTADCPK